MIERAIARLAPGRDLRWLRRLLRPARLGTMRRLAPVSDLWGYDRGDPVDRFYIEAFLERHRADIRGRVLEVKDSAYTRRFGSGVVQVDVLDIDPTNSRATIVADLERCDGIQADRFDCCIITQTLQYVYDVDSAVRQIHRILRPGGVLLATVPGISRLDFAVSTADYWRFSPAACRRLFGSVFGESRVSVEDAGNVLTAIGSVTGLARQDFTSRELAARDPRFPVIVAVRAVKALEAQERS